MSSASALEHLVQAACDTGTGDAEAAAGTGAAAAGAAPVQASQIQVLEIDAFSSVHDLIHAAILSSRGAASLKEVYEVCQRNGRIAYKRAGGSRLITSNEHWKSQIRHALYTSDRFQRVPGSNDLWQVTPAYGSQQPQLVKVLVRADEGSGVAAQPLNLPTSPGVASAWGGPGGGSAGARAAGAAAAGRSGASRRKGGGGSKTQGPGGERGSGGGKRGGKSRSASPEKAAAAAPKRSSRRASKRRRSPSYDESDQEEEEQHERSDSDLVDDEQQPGGGASLGAAASPRSGRKASWQDVTAKGAGRAAGGAEAGAADARVGLSSGHGGVRGGGAQQEQQQAPAVPAGLEHLRGDANPLASGFSSSPGGSAGPDPAPPPSGTSASRRKRALQQQAPPVAAAAWAPATTAARAAAYSPLSDGRAVGPAAVAAGVLSPSPRSAQPRSPGGLWGSRGAVVGAGSNGGRTLASPVRASGLASHSSFPDPSQLRWGATGVRSTLQPPTAESLLGMGSSAALQATAQTAPQPRRQAASAEADSPPLAEARRADAHRAIEEEAADVHPAVKRRALQHEHPRGPSQQHAKQQAGRAGGLVALTPSQLERPAVPELHPSPLPSPVVASPAADVWSSAMRGYLPAVMAAQHPQQQQVEGMAVRAAHPGMLLAAPGGMAAMPFASFVPPFFQAGPGLMMAAPAAPYYAHQLMQPQLQQQQAQQQQQVMQEALLAAQQAEQAKQPSHRQQSREHQQRQVQQQQWCTGTSQQPGPGDVPKQEAP
ncbi:hypothetical protein N2152v2_010612 [Parachlorella kessleri]